MDTVPVLVHTVFVYFVYSTPILVHGSMSQMEGVLTSTIAEAGHEEEGHLIGPIAHAIGDTGGTLDHTGVSR